MTDYHNQMTGEYGDPNFVEGPSHDEATELMLAHKEIERLRAAFKKYAWHNDGCNGYDKDGKYVLEHCSCGYRDIMFGENGLNQQ
jgi:hypothetical protein